MPAFTKSPDVISIPEAASRGYACEATLRRHVCAGRLPSVRIRHRIWLRISDLDAYFGLAAITSTLTSTLLASARSTAPSACSLIISTTSTRHVVPV